MKNNQLAEKLISHITSHDMQEPNIRFRGSTLELIWSNGGNIVKAHLDEYNHATSLITYVQNEAELNEDSLLESLRELYKVKE